MPLLKQGDQVALVGCSNGQALTMESKIHKLIELLESWGLEVVCSPYLYAKEDVFAGTGKERADALMAFYKAPKVRAIFDISGGDVANEVLPYLDFDQIAKEDKVYFGYSDLTTVINSLYAKSHKCSYLYQVRHLVGSEGSSQQRAFYKSLFEGEEDLFNFDYDFIQGNQLEGVVVGGNIRCLLKLAGTPYMPDFTDKVLFLEGLSGKPGQITTFLNQYKQMGVFQKIRGILLGSFTQMEAEQLTPTVETLLMNVLEDSPLPIAKTREIGHGEDAKCLRIGQTIRVATLQDFTGCGMIKK